MKRRLAMLTTALVLPVGTASAAAQVDRTTMSARAPEREVGFGQIRYEGHGPEWWAGRSRQWHRRYTQARRSLLSSPSVREAIDLSCATYGYCSTLWRKARCESGLSSFAKNRYSDASGLFQFLPSTFASTPFGRMSIWSPYANAMAAGWMHANGRGGEWVCR